jgi:hypothetical protein
MILYRFLFTTGFKIASEYSSFLSQDYLCSVANAILQVFKDNVLSYVYFETVNKLLT